ncbi:hypothetical protein MFUL124B02_43195 [Myxococcus fulvus 124B02]|nr:hypothetical protein MFUL124B02_43195 [Myxococcus fulvus 124B02]
MPCMRRLGDASLLAQDASPAQVFADVRELMPREVFVRSMHPGERSLDAHRLRRDEDEC